MLRRLLFLGLFLAHNIVVLAQSPGEPREITVAAAADLSSALRQVADVYQNKTGVQVKLSFGSSGGLTQQIENGAPFDVFLSADMDYPARLIKDGYADQSSLYRYAVGRLVLWVASDSPLDPAKAGIQVLFDPLVKKIAIANPEHAPYGRAAVAVFQHYGVYERVSSRLVLGENVAQAAQFVESGNAQAGMVALARVLSTEVKDRGKYWPVPADACPQIDQGIVVLTHSTHRQDGFAFVEYMKTAAAAAILRRYGFELPAEKQ